MGSCEFTPLSLKTRIVVKVVYDYVVVEFENDRDYLSYEWVAWCLFIENAIHMDTCRSGTLVDRCLFGISCEQREGNAKQRSGHQGFYSLHLECQIQ